MSSFQSCVEIEAEAIPIPHGGQATGFTPEVKMAGSILRSDKEERSASEDIPIWCAQRPCGILINLVVQQKATAGG